MSAKSTEVKKKKKYKEKYSDTARLDFLDSIPREYTGKIILRDSTTGRGWRLHETSQDGFSTVREAIDEYMRKSNKGGK